MASQPDFQDLLFQLFEMILQANALCSVKENRKILAEGLNIWVSLITANSDLLKKFYTSEAEKKKFVSLLIDQGLLDS